MARELCMFCGDEDVHLVRFTLTLENADAQTEIMNYLTRQGVEVRFGYHTEGTKGVKYEIFTLVEENADVGMITEGLGALDPVIEVDRDISYNASLLSTEFPLQLLGERAIILRATTFVDILKILNEHAPQPDTILFLSGLRGGVNAVKYFAEAVKLEKNNLITILSDLLFTCGWGEIEIDFDFDYLKGRIKVSDSFIADTFGKTESAVCSYMSGYFAGFFSEVLGKNMHVEETVCKSTGSPYCEHTIYQAPESKIEHLARGMLFD